LGIIAHIIVIFFAPLGGAFDIGKEADGIAFAVAQLEFAVVEFD
jgi:hypothetical protein